ncbi:hypothetical protein Patl1_14933 [Pistacia atlantica]|uniref:Uncharacterized protein n=1 Tax=Pistacia atlantica TaxID=434234 RepID=A0ACC1B7R0_9ROSI|nr:hypothetical protein Patl1_14933 [Pistacia atlantica]
MNEGGGSGPKVEAAAAALAWKQKTLMKESFPYVYSILELSLCLSIVLRKEGPRALYKAWLSSVIGVIPFVGLNFVVYESINNWLIKAMPFGLLLELLTKQSLNPPQVFCQRMQMVGWKKLGHSRIFWHD